MNSQKFIDIDQIRDAYPQFHFLFEDDAVEVYAETVPDHIEDMDAAMEMDETARVALEAAATVKGYNASGQYDANFEAGITPIPGYAKGWALRFA